MTTDLFEAVRTRRSAGLLLDGSPSDDEVRDLVELAMTSPDHAGLRPWRLVLLRGRARNRLGRALAEAHGGDPDASDKAAAKPLRAPLLISIVFRPREHPKVPEWEQLAATTAVVTTLVLLLHGRGWGTMWRTGALLDSAPVRRALRLADDERLLGWLYVGEPDPDGGRSPRPQANVDPHVSVLTD